ncbi:MAG TPA: amidohydrolase family protein, partial [Terriglobales bacterium]|nr:amidohydrolase family protein [Terriglobales bacterium]
GFTPVQAVQIYTQNGARYLGIANRVGSIAAGKQADLVVVRGDPSQKISDIENVLTVYKQGKAYDPAKLIASVRDSVGLH